MIEIEEKNILDGEKPEGRHSPELKYLILGIVISVPNVFFMMFSLKKSSFSEIGLSFLICIASHLFYTIVLGIILIFLKKRLYGGRSSVVEAFAQAYCYVAAGIFFLILLNIIARVSIKGMTT